MKKELIKYVMERANECYQDDFPINEIETWINEFFNQYQPESSKREDPVSKIAELTGSVMRSWENNVINELGCGTPNSMET
jgi:hypothetical protein